MVTGHEDYPTGISKVILSPTSMFPDGKNYFFVDTEDLDLIFKLKNCKFYGKWDTRAYPAGARLYQAIIKKHTGNVPECVDHINGLSIDNTSRNLNPVLRLQNRRNKPWRGYKLCYGGSFILSNPLFDGQIKDSYLKMFSQEDKMVLSRMEFESEYWSDYGYNFLLDRRGELDILDMEYRGKISSEEAIHKHVMRVASENVWYVLRYNLFDYFEEHNIPVPEYHLNEAGRMCSAKNNILLCPLG